MNSQRAERRSLVVEGGIDEVPFIVRYGIETRVEGLVFVLILG